MTSTAATISWQASAGADSYTVRRDGTAVANVAGTTFSDTGLSADVAYAYTVVRDQRQRLQRSEQLALGADPDPAPQWGRVAHERFSGADLGTAWRAPSYNDATWQRGPSQWGFGDGDEQTVLIWASNPRPTTAYGRTTVDVGPSTAGITGLQMRILVDDSAVVYINGTEVYRFNLPDGPIAYDTRALRYVAGGEEDYWRTIDLPADALVPGQNVIAVEVHQDKPSSSDISLDMELSPVR